MIVYCDNCGNELKRSPSQVLTHNFCCRKCLVAYRARECPYSEAQLAAMYVTMTPRQIAVAAAGKMESDVKPHDRVVLRWLQAAGVQLRTRGEATRLHFANLTPEQEAARKRNSRLSTLEAYASGARKPAGCGADANARAKGDAGRKRENARRKQQASESRPCCGIDCGTIVTRRKCDWKQLQSKLGDDCEWFCGRSCRNRTRNIRRGIASAEAATRDHPGQAWCYRCRSWLPRSSFASGNRNGLYSSCRQCTADMNRNLRRRKNLDTLFAVASKLREKQNG